MKPENKGQQVLRLPFQHQFINIYEDNLDYIQFLIENSSDKVWFRFSGPFGPEYPLIQGGQKLDYEKHFVPIEWRLTTYIKQQGESDPCVEFTYPTNKNSDKIISTVRFLFIGNAHIKPLTKVEKARRSELKTLLANIETAGGALTIEIRALNRYLNNNNNGFTDEQSAKIRQSNYYTRKP